MSKLVSTAMGQFRHVVDSDGSGGRWLFECPHCHENLPMSEDHLNGSAPIDHESRAEPGRLCTFQGAYEFGSFLVARMQARVMTGSKPYHDEGEPP